jgi:hypothetical protein
VFKAQLKPDGKRCVVTRMLRKCGPLQCAKAQRTAPARRLAPGNDGALQGTWLERAWSLQEASQLSFKGPYQLDNSGIWVKVHTLRAQHRTGDVTAQERRLACIAETSLPEHPQCSTASHAFKGLSLACSWGSCLQVSPGKLSSPPSSSGGQITAPHASEDDTWGQCCITQSPGAHALPEAVLTTSPQSSVACGQRTHRRPRRQHAAFQAWRSLCVNSRLAQCALEAFVERSERKLLMRALRHWFIEAGGHTVIWLCRTRMCCRLAGNIGEQIVQ